MLDGRPLSGRLDRQMHAWTDGQMCGWNDYSMLVFRLSMRINTNTNARSQGKELRFQKAICVYFMIK